MLEKKTNNQSNCVPQSSNCIIWQGPDIPCINLCKGDSITDVTYKLATELCEVLNVLDITKYDFDCLLDQEICPKFQNIQDLMNFIIEKLCELEECCETNTEEINIQKSVTFPIMQIAACFQQADQFGALITQMPIDQYITAIGNKVCSLQSSLTLLQNQLVSVDNRVTILETNFALLPPVPNYVVATSCLFPLLTDIPILTFVENTEAALCDLKARLGSNAELLSAINENCVSETDIMVSVNQPYSALPKFVDDADYTTVADAINNMWLVICDLRQAVIDLQACCSVGCPDITVSINTLLTAFIPNNFRVSLDAIIPSGVTQCTPALKLIFTDACGVVTTHNLATYNFNATTSVPLVDIIGLTTSIGYNVRFESCFTLPDGTTCYKNNDLYVDSSEVYPCPTVTWSAGSQAGQADYQFTAINTAANCPVTYVIQVFEAGTDNLLAIGQSVSSGGVVNGTITVGVPRPVDIEWRVLLLQGNFHRTCNKVGTFTIAV